MAAIFCLSFNLLIGIVAADGLTQLDASTYQGYHAKRALPAMLTHGR